MNNNNKKIELIFRGIIWPGIYSFYFVLWAVMSDICIEKGFKYILKADLTMYIFTNGAILLLN